MFTLEYRDSCYESSPFSEVKQNLEETDIAIQTYNTDFPVVDFCRLHSTSNFGTTINEFFEQWGDSYNFRSDTPIRFRGNKYSVEEFTNIINLLG